jgi:hypothetical protein
MVAPGTALMRAFLTGRPAQILDATESVGYKSRIPSGRAIVNLGGARTILYVPLVKDLTSIGVFTFYRQEVRLFSDWTEEPTRAQRPINARSETAAKSGRLRGALSQRRCIVLADAFYEWKVVEGGKQPTRLPVRMTGRWPSPASGKASASTWAA